VDVDAGHNPPRGEASPVQVLPRLESERADAALAGRAGVSWLLVLTTPELSAVTVAGARHGERQPPLSSTHAEKPMPPSPIHVEPNSKGRWIVRHEDAREPLSEHGTATDAERVARALAQVEEASFVVLHDRYARIHHLRIEGPITDEPRTAPKPHGGSGRPRPPALRR
jgi:hypothetical protein